MESKMEQIIHVERKIAMSEACEWDSHYHCDGTAYGVSKLKLCGCICHEKKAN